MLGYPQGKPHWGRHFLLTFFCCRKKVSRQRAKPEAKKEGNPTKQSEQLLTGTTTNHPSNEQCTNNKPHPKQQYQATKHLILSIINSGHDEHSKRRFISLAAIFF
jgi:hypothetical protein